VAVPLAAVALHRVGVRLGPLGRKLVRPTLAGFLSAAVAYLMHQALLGTNSFWQLSISGTAGLLAYLVTAIPRADLKVWLAGLRAARTPSAPVPG